MTKRVLVLWADNQSANFGVRVLAVGAAELARRAWGRDTIIEFQDYGTGDSDVSFGAKAIVADALGRRRDITRRIESFDIILDTGAGDSFTDIYGFKRLSTMMNAVRISNRLGIPRVITPQTVGPFNTRLGRTIGAWSLKNAHLVIARDSASAEYSHELGRTADLLATDMVFALPVESPDRDRDVIVNVSGLLWVGNAHTDNQRYQAAVLGLIESLSEKGRKIALLAHVIGSKATADDVYAINEVLRQTSVDVEVLIPSNLTQARQYLASANIVIGSRMHACLNALSQGVPAISWAYSRKFAPLMGDLGWKFVVDLALTDDPVGDTIQMLELATDYPMQDLRDRADEHVQSIVDGLARVGLAAAAFPGRDSLPEEPSLGQLGPLPAPVSKVVESGNCTGCGGCTLVYSQLRMGLHPDGFLRPERKGPTLARGEWSSEQDDRFRSICPGCRVDAPTEGVRDHPVFGRYMDAWQAHAVDPEVRFAGSSGGVLTALSSWLVETGRVESVAGVSGAGTRTVPLQLTTRAEALSASGSRYAPASALSGMSHPLGSSKAMVGKPCEASALRQIVDSSASKDGPVILSFFCAGTPSQKATDRLLAELGIDAREAEAVRYRGRGWPGKFTATSAEHEVEMTYHESWGKHLGRDIQPVCKICPDGTGGSADISVGDYWHSDEHGFPLFEDAPGSSVVIARTRRGAELVQAAAEAGVVEIAEVDLDAVARVQPLQRERRLTLAARLVGKRLALRSVPDYHGFASTRRLLRHRWRQAPRVTAGSFMRARRFARYGGGAV